MRKLSVNALFGYSLPLVERLRMIKATGFDEVVLFWGEKFLEIDGYRDLHPEMARGMGLGIENIHAPIGEANLFWIDSGDSDDYEKRMLQCITDCAKYDIPAVVYHITCPEPPIFNQIGLDRFKRMVDYAEKKNINIAIENIWHIDYLEYIFKGIESKRLGFCYDSGHENCFTNGSDLLTKFGSKLMALHLHDNDGIKDLHQIPGYGTIEWTQLLHRVKLSGYNGAFALELNTNSKECVDESVSRIFLEEAFTVGKRLSEVLENVHGNVVVG
jgi:sugar phosphate isomerase/epimerase